MSERRAFKPQPRDLNPARLRHEWVSIDDGDIVIREMTMKETAILIQKAQRPQEYGGGTDLTEDTIWSCILSCFVGDEPDAKPCWSNPPTADDVRYIMGLRAEELGRIQHAIIRVNGMEPKETQAVQAFTAPSEGGLPSPSPPSASANWDDVRKKSNSQPQPSGVT